MLYFGAIQDGAVYILAALNALIYLPTLSSAQAAEATGIVPSSNQGCGGRNSYVANVTIAVIEA